MYVITFASQRNELTLIMPSLQDWILWALFSADRNTLDSDWEEELEHYVGTLENIMGHPLQDGYNPAVNISATLASTNVFIQKFLGARFSAHNGSSGLSTSTFLMVPCEN